MLSLATARLLKEAGLEWTPAVHDFFAIPDRGFDERTFVISDMSSELTILSGYQAVTFQGGLEWTLDYVMVSELVWMPSEEQLREGVLGRLDQGAELALRRAGTPARYQCELALDGQALSFDRDTASEAYAAALLHLLARRRYPHVDTA